MVDSLNRYMSNFPVTNYNENGNSRKNTQIANKPARINAGDFSGKTYGKKNYSDPNSDKKRKLTGYEFAPLAALPHGRRFFGIAFTAVGGNPLKAAGLIAFGLMNIPEDARDFMSCYNQLVKKVETVPRNYQSTFVCLRGTLLEPLLKFKNVYKKDVTVMETKLGVKLLKLCGGHIKSTMETKRPDIMNKPVMAYEFGGSRFGKLMGQTMTRTPVLTYGYFSLLELPAIIKAFKTGDNRKEKLVHGTAQIFKSTVNVFIIFLSMGAVGAMLSKKGPTGSIVGMGLGSVLECMIDGKLNKTVDNFVDKKILHHEKDETKN